MDFSKLLHGFVKLLHRFVKVVLCISYPLPNNTKLIFEYFWASTFLPTSEVHYKKSNSPLANALDAPSDKQIAIVSLPHIGWAVQLGLEWMFSSRYWWFQWIMLIMKLTWWSRLASNWRRFKLKIFNGVKLTAARHRVKSATCSGKPTSQCEQEEPQIHLSMWSKRPTNSSLNVKQKGNKFISQCKIEKDKVHLSPQPHGTIVPPSCQEAFGAKI